LDSVTGTHNSIPSGTLSFSSLVVSVRIQELYVNYIDNNLKPLLILVLVGGGAYLPFYICMRI